MRCSRDIDAHAAVTGVVRFYTITPFAQGTCAVTFTDAFKQTVTLPVSVTVSDLTVK